ncbi:molecular chaperone [Enterobacter cloacae]|nr:molecular chaperone [Enterobacter cloacae]
MMKKKNRRHGVDHLMHRVALGLAGCFLMLALPAQAFVLGGTRVILPEGDVASLSVLSAGKDDVLLIKAGASKDLEGKVKSPEIQVSPPLFRLDKGGRSTLRIQLMTSAGIERGRETLRYLRVSGIPSSNPLSRDPSTIKAGVVLGQGAIIKILIRPTGLRAPTDETWKALSATRVPGGIKLTNPTPYYMNFVDLRADKRLMTPVGERTGMLPPFSEQVYGTSSMKKQEIEWAVLNDIGATIRGKTPVH